MTPRTAQAIELSCQLAPLFLGELQLPDIRVQLRIHAELETLIRRRGRLDQFEMQNESMRRYGRLLDGKETP